MCQGSCRTHQNFDSEMALKQVTGNVRDDFKVKR